MNKIKIGVSSCLLGNTVRFDGQHKRDAFITEVLSEYCDFVPVCPEVECGMSIPRETLRLVGTPESPRLMTGKTKRDYTTQMMDWAKNRLEELAQEDLVAFIFKTKSPSSGLRAVKVYNQSGHPVSYKGQGLFARAFVERFPDLPVEDEGRLKDAGLRENFIETIFVLQRWREHVRNGKAAELVTFHSRHKYTLMAHSPAKLRVMGALVARAGLGDFDEIRRTYFQELLTTLQTRKTVKKNTNVLLHVGGYFKTDLGVEEKEELNREIELYHKGINPLQVPLTLIRHFSRKYKREYLLSQHFLSPHPVEMGLLNGV
ncbi:MAG: DUF523 and DUF1722 domain-containing protein [Spirochaetales bacterium]|nr:DUF523 and DUF1722 domain-containing protein [Spirochaetales bacterium]